MTDLYRSYSDEEIQKFFDHFMKSSGELTSLRKLFGLAHSHSKPIIPDEVVIALESTLCDKTISTCVHEVCASILQEILPCNVISYEDVLQEHDDRNFNILMLLLAVQSDQPQHKIEFCKAILMQLKPAESNGNLKMKALKLLAQWVTSGQHISDDDVRVVARMIKACLGPISSSSIRVKKRDKIIEMDGSPATEMYTLLTLPENITDDYHLNCQAFSILNQMWSTIFDRTFKSNEIDELEVTILNYCLRIVEQTQRIPIKSEDAAFQQVALIEVINLLDKISLSEMCRCAIQIYEVAESIFMRYSNVETVLPVLQLLIHLNAHKPHDLSDKLEKLFSDYLTKVAHNLCSSGETVLFLKKNLDYLNSLSPSPLRVWFPNILKILAWYPVTFVDDFEELIPTFMDENTSVEVLSLILDLPCSTLALMYTLEPSSINKNDLVGLNKKELQLALRKSFQSEENFGASGLHKGLKSIVGHPRVIAAAKVVPNLLQNCLEIVITYANSNLAGKIIGIILERSISMSESPHQIEEINKIFADAVLHIFRCHPQLVVDVKEDILQFFQLIEEPSQELCINMVWITGQYTSSLYFEDFPTDLPRVYYDALECLVYEHLPSLSSKAISVIVSTFVKISSRCHDIIPRVKLLLNKVKQSTKGRQDESEEWATVILRIDEASIVLDETSCNQNSFSVENLIRFVTAIMEENTAIATPNE